MGDQSAKVNKTKNNWLRRNVVKAVIILSAVVILTVIMKMPAKKRESPATEAPPVNVTVMTVKAEPQLADMFDLPAVVEPNRIVTVSSEVGGRIERIPLEEGSKVRTGDLLVKLNTDLILPEFESAKAQVERDQIEFDRMTNLSKENAATQRELDNATSQLAISKARLEGISARLERTSIFAPIAGVLNALLVEEGEYIDVGKPVAQVVDSDTVKVVVDIPERDVAFFSVGEQAEVLANARDPNESLTGTITFISELADSKTRTTRTEITLDNRQRLLRSGQIVNVRLTRRILKDVILVPLLAVIPMEDGKAVYVVNSSHAKRCDVKLGIIRRDQVQIESGLEPGDKLIIAGHRFVAPGQKVNIVPEKK
ncbi:MAG: efflux RND transporter periplasmic adaptor subunit [Sedimentisphaerales bacterium]|nr:efflux RND transporter periplasmic adaptor subunit [Sedimentisphaerales bacterium]